MAKMVLGAARSDGSFAMVKNRSAFDLSICDDEDVKAWA
jgi:hypothetical protein